MGQEETTISTIKEFCVNMVSLCDVITDILVTNKQKLVYVWEIDLKIVSCSFWYL